MAVSCWLFISARAQARNKPAEALEACGQAIKVADIFEGQSGGYLYMTLYILDSKACRGIEATLSRVTGNIEDVRTKSHTTNPAFLGVWDKTTSKVYTEFKTLQDIYPYILFRITGELQKI